MKLTGLVKFSLAEQVCAIYYVPGSSVETIYYRRFPVINDQGRRVLNPYKLVVSSPLLLAIVKYGD